MLPKIALQMIAACMLYESDMPRPAKLQMLYFIENATTEIELRNYIVYGKFSTGPEIDKVNEASFLLPGAVIASAIAAGRAFYEKQFGEAARACIKLKGQLKKDCMQKFKLKGMSGKISALRREMGKCNQTLRPDKCRKMFLNYIKTAEKQMRKIQQG